MGQLAGALARKRLSLFHILLAAVVFGTSLIAREAPANVKEALWLSLAPAPAKPAANCELHGTPSAPPKGKRGDTHEAGTGRNVSGKPQSPQRFESEHRPVPVRTYYLKGPTLSPGADAYVLHPDGTSEQLNIRYGPQPAITVKTPMADDRLHGANNIYVIDKQVVDGVLISQSAKWLSIHHSCGWGHDYRNDDARTTAHPFDKVPLEIVINGLWDENFHADVQSGKELAILITKEGHPVKGASVTVTTEKQWSHTAVTDENGIAKVQLIRDYYPNGWENFKRSQEGRFTVTAEYFHNETGQYNGQPYRQIHSIATFSWKYTPAQADYQSYAFGLGIGAFFLTFTGIGVYSFRERRKKPYKGISFD